jgi:hypothetical protein
VASTTDLGKWMLTNGGEYNPETAYEQLTMVMYENSTYITLKTVQGITPTDDHINYQLMAKGFNPTALESVQAEDTSGVLGEVGGTVSAQDLIDWVVDQAATKLLKISDLVSVQTNDATKGVSAALAYAMGQKLDQLNSNLGHFQYAVIKSKQSHTFNVNATCWFVLHGNTDQNGSLFAGDVRGRLYTLCGGDSSTNVLVSYDDGKLTITNNINWAEVFIVFG